MTPFSPRFMRPFSRGVTGGGLTALQSKFDAWIEAGITSERVTGSAVTGTASLIGASAGIFADGWTNGTLDAGVSLDATASASLVVIYTRQNLTGDGTIPNFANIGTTGFGHYNGVFWMGRLLEAGAVSSFASDPNVAGLHMLTLTRDSGAEEIIVQLDDGTTWTIPKSGKTGDISGAVTATMGSNGRIYALGACSEVLTPDDTARLYNSGAFRLWADL